MAKDNSMFIGAYESALRTFADQIQNKKTVQIDPHLPNLIARYFALPEMWPKDWENDMKKQAKELYKTLPKEISLGTMRDYVLVVRSDPTQIVIGFYNGDIYTYNKVGESWVKQ
jgi:hypothetical protein